MNCHVNHSTTNVNVTLEKAKDAGGTAQGGVSHQQFVDSYENFPVEAPITLELRLKGPTPQVESPWRVEYNAGFKVFYQGQLLVGWEAAEFDSSGQLVLKIKNFRA